MPWHVIVHHNKPQPGDPWPLVDQVFRKEDYPDKETFLDAICQAKKDLRRAYPPPDYTVVSGSGPESSSPAFSSFVVWLLRDD